MRKLRKYEEWDIRGNWPHPNEIDKPNDARLFDLLTNWAPHELTRNRILVTNPETLYGFTKAD